MLRRIAFSCLVVVFGLATSYRALAAEAGAKTVVPVFRLSGAITEQPVGEQLPLFDQPGTSLKDLTERMDKAAKDPAVKAVILTSEGAEIGLGQVEELRKSIGGIRAAGKDVYVHADGAHIGTYYLYSAASRISMSPTADLWVGGLHGEQPYVRGLLDKIGVEPDYLTCGDYKSAAEMFMRTGPSKPADEMMNWLLDSIFNSMVEQIAAGRKMKPEDLRKRIDAALYSAEKAKEAGLIDAVEHRQDFEAMLRKQYGNDITFDRKYGKPAEKQIDLSNPFAALKIWGEILGGAKEKKASGPSVAIVYVEGMIIPGSKQSSPFGGGGGFATSTDIRKALDKAAEDDSVKAVVLRVDSPGGSAVASEIILDATKRVKAKKPFVVSMGNVAGSGGYYVSCGTDTIFADETTITASIGVVAGKFVTNGMWDKVGITFKDYNRGKNADLLSSSHKFTDEQRAQLKGWMDEVYGVFKGHVTAARGNKLKKPIDEIAGGRVYTGRQALELGLVDQIGTMNDAVKHVAKQANLQEGYAVRVIPEPKSFIETIIESMSGDAGEDAKHVMLRTETRTSMLDLAIPYLRQLDPGRVDAVRTALLRLDLMREESVIVAMPEIVVGGAAR